jgi:hypothetical protein
MRISQLLGATMVAGPLDELAVTPTRRSTAPPTGAPAGPAWTQTPSRAPRGAGAAGSADSVRPAGRH